MTDTKEMKGIVLSSSKVNGDIYLTYKREDGKICIGKLVKNHRKAIKAWAK